MARGGARRRRVPRLVIRRGARRRREMLVPGGCVGVWRGGQGALTTVVWRGGASSPRRRQWQAAELRRTRGVSLGAFYRR
jgi:hypothetical protein